MEEKLLDIENENIKNLIYTIRGKQVMLDSDVANLYKYKTKALNLAVRRNLERFPEEFCFQLTEDEFKNLRCQFVTLNRKFDNEMKDLRFQIETSNNNEEKTNNKRGGRRYLPHVLFNKEYPVLNLAKTNKFHDRFIVIDNKELYHVRSFNKRLR